MALKNAELYSNSLLSGYAYFTEDTFSNLQQVYVNFSSEADNKYILNVYDAQSDFASVLQTYHLHNEALALDSGMILQNGSGSRLRIFKKSQKELHYVSLVLTNKTISILFDEDKDRIKWKGRIMHTLNLDQSPRKMLLVDQSHRHGTESIMLHIVKTKIIFTSERKESQPAGLKLLWDVTELDVVRVENSLQLVLINNKNLTKRLECFKSADELKAIASQIERIKRRTNPARDGKRHPSSTSSSSQSSPSNSAGERPPTPPPINRQRKLSEPHVLQLPPREEGQRKMSVDVSLLKSGKFKDMNLQSQGFDVSELPPPEQCPGFRKNVMQIYGIPALTNILGPSLTARPKSDYIYNMNKAAEHLVKEMGSLKPIASKRESMVNKICNFIDKSSEDQTVHTQKGDIENVCDLDKEEQLIYGVGNIIHEVIHHFPEKNTLNLSISVRREICMKLYQITRDGAKRDWTAFASAIGMTLDAVTMISAFLQNQITPGNQTCAEVVFRHWQYTYNNYPADHKYYPKVPCTIDGLKHVLKSINRHDIHKYLEEQLQKENVRK